MSIYLILALTLIALAAARFYLIKQTARTSFPFKKKAALFTPAEKLFLNTLTTSVDNKYLIFGKVRLADILDLQKGLSGKQRTTAFNQISNKHIDFLLCNKDDFSIACGIELDDKSHSLNDRRNRDDFINKAFAVASLPLLRFQAKSKYDITTVKSQLNSILKTNT